jgi:hypothetical protein
MVNEDLTISDYPFLHQSKSRLASRNKLVQGILQAGIPRYGNASSVDEGQ